MLRRGRGGMLRGGVAPEVPGGRMGGVGAAGGGALGVAAAQRIGTRFTMKERIFAFGDDYWIKDERGQNAIKVDGKLLRLRDTLHFEDAHGRQLYQIKARIVDIRETMDILRPDGAKAAVVHNAWFSPIRDRWQIDVPGGQHLEATGNIVQHEYTVSQRGSRMPLAVVSKKWIRLVDTYTIEVASAFDAALMCAITVVIDMMSHEASSNKDHGINRGSGLDLF